MVIIKFKSIILTFILIIININVANASEKIYIPEYIYMNIERVSLETGVDSKLITGVMLVENRQFNPYLVYQGNHGLMQINNSNLREFRSMGFYNIYDPYQNIYYGAMKLKWASEKYSELWKILTVYNCGEGGAKKIFSRQSYWNYSNKVINYMNNTHLWEYENKQDRQDNLIKVMDKEIEYANTNKNIENQLIMDINTNIVKNTHVNSSKDLFYLQN